MTNWLPIAAATAVGAISGYFGYPDSFKSASGLLATFASFVSAAIVPTMILAATILRPAKLSIPALRSYRDAVRLQLTLFAGVIVIAAGLIVSLVAANIVGWQDHRWLLGPRSEIAISQASIFNFMIGSLSSLLIFRLFSFVNGIISLFEVHFKMVEQEAADRVRIDTERLFASDPHPHDMRREFGMVLRLNSEPD